MEYRLNQNEEERNMKRAIVFLVAALCVVGLTGLGWAAETDSIAVSVELESTVSVSVTPDDWIIGAIALSGTDTQSCSADNNGNVNIDLDVRATNGAGGWTLGSSVATDVFAVDFGTSFYLTTSDLACATDLAFGTSLPFDLTYEAPSGDTVGGGVSQGFTITFSASATP